MLFSFYVLFKMRGKLKCYNAFLSYLQKYECTNCVIISIVSPNFSDHNIIQNFVMSFTCLHRLD